MVIDKGNVEQAAIDFQGTYRTILSTTLMHEFIPVQPSTPTTSIPIARA